MSDNTPVMIGVGEASERIDAPDYAALSPVALAARAAAAALVDAGAPGLAAHIDTIAAIRQFEVSGPNARPPFGASDNFARSVGKRVGADPSPDRPRKVVRGAERRARIGAGNLELADRRDRVDLGR